MKIKNFLKIKIKIKSKQKGFTLIESLVSIALILIAVIGPLSTAVNAINSIIQNRNRVIASYLAEEIVENFRMYRDSIALACSEIDYGYSPDTGDLLSANCVKGFGVGNGLYVDPNYIKNDTYTSRSIAWKLFLDRIATIKGQDVTLDKNSFPTTLDNINNKPNCGKLAISSDGYVCSNIGNFERTVNVSEVLNNNVTTFVKISVSVVYAKSYLFGVKDKSVNVVDYIYAR